MKYIKKYKKKIINFHYNIGDYLLLSSNWIKDGDKICKVIGIDNVPGFHGNMSTFGVVEFSDGSTIFVYDSMVVRKLTNKEIEEYEIGINSNKFNL
jgi:hypothetical protein